jgi:hypothetical protein
MLVVLNVEELKSLVGHIAFVADETPLGSADCKLAIKLIKEILREDTSLESTRLYLEQLNRFMSEYENQILQEQEN